MAIQLHGKSLLCLKQLTEEEILYLLALAHRVKKEKKQNKTKQRFKGKSLAMIFEKRSTRTRCAFETAFGEEGGCPVFLSTADIHLGVKESIEDTARVLGRMFDAIMFRGFKQETVETLAAYAGVPVYNALTDTDHPTQALADLMTIQEEFGSLKNRKLVFIGDGRNNVCNSLLIGSAKLGLDFTVIAPPQLQPDKELLIFARQEAQKKESTVNVTADIMQGVAGADVIYTDVWVSMGEEKLQEERLKLLRDYQVNEELMAATGKKETIFIHCLPAVKGKEVTKEVFEGRQSRVWEQAENRKHTIKALMIATI
jgi:ornithine carbamoyltransferase